MSYTLTIEEPEKVTWLERHCSKLSQEQLGALFVSFLLQNEKEIFEGDSKDGRTEEGGYIRQRKAILDVAGGWQDDRTEDEVIADIESHRTPGREVVL